MPAAAPAPSLSPGRQPIFLTGAPRSGTSWLGEQLAGGAGLRYVYEPFNHQWNPGLRPVLKHFEYLRGTAQPDSTVSRVAERAFRGRQSRKQLLRALYRGYWRPALRRHCRVLVKDPTAVLMTEWLAQRFESRIVLVVRHPCGFASSMGRLGWQLNAQRLLRQPALMADYLGPYEALLRQAGGDPWLLRGVYWGALHTVLLQQARRYADWLVLSYEDLCRDPQGQLQQVLEQLGLPASSLPPRRVAGSAAGQHDPGSTRRDSARMPDIWKQRLSGAQIDAVSGIVAEFGLGDLVPAGCR